MVTNILPMFNWCFFQWSEDAKNYIATSASRAFDSVLTTLGCGKPFFKGLGGRGGAFY